MFFDLLQQRRSIRKYTDQPVETEKLDQIVEAALRSPSSRSLNPWSFVVVTDPAMLERLSRVKPHGASFLKKAPTGIVVCADPERCDVWVEDASIATILIHLAAAALGLGSCWIQIRGRPHDEGKSAGEYARELLSIPEPFEVECILALGEPDEEKPGHPPSSLDHGKIHENRW